MTHREQILSTSFSSKSMISSLRHLCALCVSAVYRFLQISTAETPGMQRLRREFFAFLIILTLLNIQLAVASPIDDLQRSFSINWTTLAS